MGNGTLVRCGLFGGALWGAFLWCASLSGAEPAPVGTGPVGRRGAETARPADPKDLDSLPMEWVAEIMHNREMLESLDLLEKLELFSGENRFSSHRFE